MNAKSYASTMLFILPAFSLGNLVARSGEFIAGFGVLTSVVLLIFIVLWNARRLQNAGRSAWWTLALIPPATIFLLGHNLLASSKIEHADNKLYIYGIRAAGFWRITLISLVSLFLVYLSALYLTFLMDGL